MSKDENESLHIGRESIMKRPLSVIIISKDPATLQETHNRFDMQTSFPRLKLLVLFFKLAFGGGL